MTDYMELATSEPKFYHQSQPQSAMYREPIARTPSSQLRAALCSNFLHERIHDGNILAGQCDAPSSEKHPPDIATFHKEVLYRN